LFLLKQEGKVRDAECSQEPGPGQGRRWERQSPAQRPVRGT